MPPLDTDPPTILARRIALKRVKRAIRSTGWTPSRLAREAGLAASTINKFLYQDVSHVLSTTTLTKIEMAAERHVRSLVQDAK
ncbi:hypothetical protein [Shumkonia mesophila]|uniref:hypothetical protein n=1 Tax=Shumkonia mesophila TaxID=2838854 RepID=UPI002934B497|nr:hypothetical protein [Shumkonia mesophila]